MPFPREDCFVFIQQKKSQVEFKKFLIPLALTFQS